MCEGEGLRPGTIWKSLNLIEYIHSHDLKANEANMPLNGLVCEVLCPVLMYFQFEAWQRHVEGIAVLEGYTSSRHHFSVVLVLIMFSFINGSQNDFYELSFLVNQKHTVLGPM